MSEEVINLPYGYKQCLFLESTGTQYINTNHVATINTGAYVEWSLTNIKNYSNVLCSVGTSSDANADCIFMLPHWNGDNNAYLTSFISKDSGSVRLENQESPKLYSIYRSRVNYFNIKSAYINDTLIGAVDNVSENLENDLPLYLFGCNKLNSLSTEDSMIGRIYRATITEGNEDVAMDLIPCLDDKGKPCMYDLISQTPFYNANEEGDDFRYVVKGKIPSWYKRVEYLESTATSGFGIDTGIKGSNNVEFSIKFNCLYSGTGCILGSRISSTRNEIQVSSHNNGIFRMGNNNYNIPFSINAIHEASLVDGKYILDDTATTVNVGNWKNDFNIHLFVLNESNNLTQGSRSKIYFCKLYENKELVRDFVPCLDDNGIPCMFDLVEGIPYYNIGSGEFLYNKGLEGSYTGFGQLSGIGNRLGGGTDGLPPTYTRVNYLESTGTQYIDTGIITDGTYTISARIALFKGNSDVFGRRSNKGEEDNILPYGNSVLNVLDNTLNYVVVNYVGRARNRNPFDITQPHDYVVTEGSIPFELNGITQSMAYLNAWAINPANLDGISYYLFWSNSSQNTTRLQKTSASVYNFCMQNGEGKVVLDFVPCLDDTGRPCMFDRVSRKSFYNNGTGEFLYG